MGGDAYEVIAWARPGQATLRPLPPSLRPSRVRCLLLKLSVFFLLLGSCWAPLPGCLLVPQHLPLFLLVSFCFCVCPPTRCLFLTQPFLAPVSCPEPSLYFLLPFTFLCSLALSWPKIHFKPCLWSPQDFLGVLAITKELRRRSTLLSHGFTTFSKTFRPESEGIVKDGSGHSLSASRPGLGALETFHPHRRSPWAPLHKLPTAPTHPPLLLTMASFTPTPCPSPASHPHWSLAGFSLSCWCLGAALPLLCSLGTPIPWILGFLPGDLCPETSACF